MKLKQAALDRYLWTALDHTRGITRSVDSLDQLSALLVLKFLDECAGRIGSNAFVLPNDARWRNVMTFVKSAEMLDDILSRVEETNEHLRGVLRRLPRAGKSPRADIEADISFLRLLDHLSTLPLRPDEHETPYALALAHEQLIRRGLEGSTGGGFDFITSDRGNLVLVGLVDPKPGETVNDPAIGTGSTLTQIIRTRGQAENGPVLSGQEIDNHTWRLAARNVLLHGHSTAQIALRDSLRTPIVSADGRLQTYDVVVTDPPWSLVNYDEKVTLSDPWNRFPDRLPPSKPEYAWVYHVLATLNPTGRAAILLSQGALTRGGEERRARARLVDLDLIEAVVALPSTRHATSIPSCAILLNRIKREDRRDRIIFIDASDSGAPTHEEGTDPAVQLARKFETVEGQSQIVLRADIERQDYNLGVARYVRRLRNTDEIDFDSALLRIRDFERQRDTAIRAMDEALKQLRTPPEEADP